MWSTTHAVLLSGAAGHVVDVQADVTQGMVSTTLVGRPDASVSEARDRCRAAVVNSGYAWPTGKRVTILFSPADLPKRGSHLDLAIALSVLAADGKHLGAERVAGIVAIGELTLDGRLRAVPGVLPMVLTARDHGFDTVMVPEAHAAEAALVPGMTVLGVRSLAQAVCLLAGEEVPEAPPVPPLSTRRAVSWRGEDRTEDLDLRDVHGMLDARFALEVAASGGHHLLLSGPRGAGKTTLAERLPGLLPDLGLEESLELSAVRSLSGEDLEPLLGARRPPFRAPHHSATKASVLGGGSGRVHPGEISRALHGVLFLDEFPLFGVDIIESLRQPLEQGEVTIARGDEVATFPARTMVVLAANPCPCGDYHPDVRLSMCTCSEVRRRAYRERVSGPVSDRVDITRHVEPVRAYELSDPLARPESSATVRDRVRAARERQADRYAGTPWRVNGDVPGPALVERWPLAADVAALVEQAVGRGRLTRRGATRVHRLAWTLADLDGAVRPGDGHVAAALALRCGDALPVAALRGNA